MKEEKRLVTITNDFMFGYVMSEPNRCKKFLEQILSIKIDHVVLLEHQKDIHPKLKAHGVRLDIYLESSREIINCEVQNVNTQNLPKRSRYYQDLMDIDALGRGENYNTLKKNIVIFICTFDPFKENRIIYTFENICKEDRRTSLDDGTTKIFINTKGKIGNVSNAFRELIAYFNDARSVLESSNELVKEIDEAVKKASDSPEWREAYMTWEMYGQDQYNLGKEEGKAEGIVETIIGLVADGLLTITDAAKRLQVSEADIQKLCDER